MKKVLLLLCLAGAFCVQTQAQQAKTPKVAIVNMESIFNKYQKAVDLRRGLEADKKRDNNELKAKEQGVLALQNELQKLQADTQSLALSEQGRANAKAAFEKKGREFVDQREAYAQAVRTADAILQRRFQNMQQVVLEDLQPIATSYCKQKGIDLVIPANTVLYFEPTLDITEELIKGLNAGYVPVAPPPAVAVPAATTPTVSVPAATK
ncbi:MAG: OmpH family outer membrane protein [Puniceicoccales bacterium]|jgi:outer membrane protein|nr:OmpH family outer membrane protein [Puniceicoccales bacterium]